MFIAALVTLLSLGDFQVDLFFHAQMNKKSSIMTYVPVEIPQKNIQLRF